MLIVNNLKQRLVLISTFMSSGPKLLWCYKLEILLSPYSKIRGPLKFMFSLKICVFVVLCNFSVFFIFKVLSLVERVVLKVAIVVSSLLCPSIFYLFYFIFSSSIIFCHLHFHFHLSLLLLCLKFRRVIQNFLKFIADVFPSPVGFPFL